MGLPQEIRGTSSACFADVLVMWLLQVGSLAVKAVMLAAERVSQPIRMC